MRVTLSLIIPPPAFYSGRSNAVCFLRRGVHPLTTVRASVLIPNLQIKVRPPDAGSAGTLARHERESAKVKNRHPSTLRRGGSLLSVLRHALAGRDARAPGGN
jgi:hypothetical protein